MNEHARSGDKRWFHFSSWIIVAVSIIAVGFVAILPYYREQQAIALLDVPGVELTLEAREPSRLYRLFGGDWNKCTGLRIMGEPLREDQLSQLRNLPYIGRVEIINQPNADPILEQFCKAGQLQYVEILDSKITDLGLQHVSANQELKVFTVTKINAPLQTYHDITDDGLKYLNNLPQLDTVWLPGPHVTDAGLAHLSKIKSLWNLSLYHSKITDGGLSHLLALPDLLSAYFNDTSISNQGLDTILKIPNLRSLSLRESQITDEGLAFLKPKTKIDTLDLSGTKITDEGLSHLSGLTNLRHIFLNQTQITDAGLKHLSSLRNLQTLHLVDTKITEEGLDVLNKLPHLAKPLTHYSLPKQTN